MTNNVIDFQEYKQNKAKELLKLSNDFQDAIDNYPVKFNACDWDDLPK